MDVIILLGPPGSGKGTVAEKVRDRLGYQHVSTGDMLREAVKNGSAVGRKADAFMKRGELVADEVIIQVVEDRLDHGRPTDRYMFDGFPRTVRQAELLDASLARRGGRITDVLLLDAPRAVLIQRLTGRRVCRQCGTSFHVVNIPPKVEGICDSCGGALYQRPDDEESTIVNRLDVYARQTENLIARYARSGVLRRLDSSQHVDKLVADLEAALRR
jgi:adenylate kinase